jgi:ABC-type nitrate/sulfonate/bicarbonate transport system ATPase subunit
MDINEDDERTMKECIVLKNLDLKVKKGEFVCIIGDVGSGKSSLLSAIIEDMIYLPREYIEANKDQKISDR